MAEPLFVVCKVPYNPDPKTILEIDWNCKPKTFICTKAACDPIQDGKYPRWAALNYKQGSQFHFAFLPSYAIIYQFTDSIEFLDFLVREVNFNDWSFAVENDNFLENFGLLILFEFYRTCAHIGQRNPYLVNTFKFKFCKHYVPWLIRLVKKAHRKTCGTDLFNNHIISIADIIGNL